MFLFFSLAYTYIHFHCSTTRTMGDPAPLLPPQTTSSHRQPSPSSLDDVIESCMGGAGTAQLLRALLVSLACVFDVQQTFISVFTDAYPAWHCSDPSACSSESQPCRLPDNAWAWNDPPKTTIISDWSLQCASPTMLSLPASAFFVGCLIGGFTLTLADSVLGRKNLLVLSCLIMSLAAGLTVVSPNVWVYVALRFVCGLGRSALGGSSLVLAREIVGKKWRDWVSVAYYLVDTLGFLFLPLVAYLYRWSSWRVLYLWTSVPCFVYSASLYFLVHESPRWLLVRGRRVEAIRILERIASENGGANAVNLSPLLDKMSLTPNEDVLSSVNLLWEKRWAFRRLVITMIVFFGIGIVYYGMPLNVGNLGSNLYLSVAMNALFALPASFVTFPLIRMANRRSSSLVLTTMSGVFSILCLFVRNETWRLGVEVMSFFCANTAFNLVMIYCTELFPTCVRMSAVSMVRQALTFGGMLAPMLVAVGRKKSFLSFGLFGLIISFCGLFIAFLPETKGKHVSDTMEEEEYRFQMKSNDTHISGF